MWYSFFFPLVEIDDLKKITNSLTVLCSEKQKQEKVRTSMWRKCIFQEDGDVGIIFWTSVVGAWTKTLSWNRAGVSAFTILLFTDTFMVFFWELIEIAQG